MKPVCHRNSAGPLVVSGNALRICRLSVCLIVVAVTSSSSVSWAEHPSSVGPLVIKLIDQVDVPALEPGPIDQLDVRVGDKVVVGQVIARIDDRISAAQRDLAATDLQRSRLRLSEYRGDAIAEKELGEKRAAVAQQKLLAKIALEKSRSDVRVMAAEKAEAVAKNEWLRASRAREKFADSVSESELESLRLKYERAGLERAQAEFERRMDQLSAEGEAEAVKVAELAAEGAELSEAVAATDSEFLTIDVHAKEKTLQIHELTLSRHQIASPIDGTVVELYKRRGEWVRPGDSVARVINLDQLVAEGFFSGSIRPERGQQVRLRWDGRETDGVVDFVSSERDSVSGEFRFLVRLRGGVFFPGDRVEIDW